MPPRAPEDDQHLPSIAPSDLPESLPPAADEGKETPPPSGNGVLPPTWTDEEQRQVGGEAPPAALLAGRYRIEREIGRGGMGVVLRGRDPQLNRDLAIKVLLDDQGLCPEVVQRFEEEAQIGGQLQHPGVVPIYELGRWGGKPYFTM